MTDSFHPRRSLRRFKNGLKRVLPGLTSPVPLPPQPPAPTHFTEAYAQVGEDMILRNLLGDKPDGFYVDVGAHHPQRFSITYYFYLRGWRGINIDAMPGSMEPFKQIRPRDINLELGVSDTRQTLTYYSFNEPALNGFSRELSLSRDNKEHFKLIGEQQIETQPLVEILDRYVPPGQSIDFMSVDVEGLDCETLRSNDWTKYRPGIVLAEDTQIDLLTDIQRSPLVTLMSGLGYALHSKAVHTLFFVRSEGDQERSLEATHAE